VNKKASSTPNPDSSKDPLIGKQLGDYRLTSILATGGMARIYKGMDYRLQRQAAVKVLAQEEIDGDKTLMKRFQREARAVAALEHDNIITIYQYGEQEGVYFLAMKLVKGKDLSQELKRLKKSGHRMDIKRALKIMDQVASALDFAHAADVVHRDIKPSNILLDDDDKAVLTDFGLVLRPSVETTMGTAFGTPRYIAPEQAISSNKALPQSDIYSLGIILYEIITGDTPFTGDTPMEIALSQISDAPPPPRTKDPSIPEAVEREILKSLDKEPEKRHRSAGEFLQSIRRAYGLDVNDTSTNQAVSIGSRSVGKNSSPSATARPSKANGAAGAKSAKRRSRLRVVLVLLLLIVLGAAAFVLINNQNGGSTNGAAITLIYNDSNFTMINGGDYTLDLNELKFIRGVDGGGDDYNGFRVTGKILPAGSCARISMQEKQNQAPPQCKAIQGSEFLTNQMLLFWRKETPSSDSNISSFEVQYKGNVVARCNTVARGGDDECRFTWPVPPPTPTGAGG
jgi:serine/threonine protein kinase